ncbi:MAG: class I SAM-dependent methyltransferase [Alphaproteobacteria bacterium]|nr:class I SAM-dependent methyltransferase [Alphaproteobacteria bacterium]
MSSTANTDMSEFWNGEGGEKWLRFQETIDASLLPFGREVMAAAGISPGERVLDVGCGCGDTSFDLARLVGSGGRVLGVDISEPILAHARARAMSVPEKNVTFERGDAQLHGFDAAAFDLVFSRFGVMFFDDPVAAFQNLRAALRPGGRAAFICWRPAKENEWVSKSLEVVSRHVALLDPPGPEEPGPMSFGDPERVTRILTASGFSTIEVNSFDTPFTIGENLDEAVAFLTQMGPASGAIAQSSASDMLKATITSDLREALVPYDTGSGITMDSATWVVIANKAE